MAKPKDDNTQVSQPLDAGEDLKPFGVAWSVMIDGQVFEAGDEILITQSQHRDLYAAGVISDAWPTVPEA